MRSPGAGEDAHDLLSVLSQVHSLPLIDAAKGGRLLRVLLIWFGEVSARAMLRRLTSQAFVTQRRKTDECSFFSCEIRLAVLEYGAHQAG
jgi:hypothetical protein